MSNTDESGADLMNRLARFRETHPIQTIQVDRYSWAYLADGHKDNPALLLLPGGGGGGDALFRHIEGLSTAFRVIVPTIPNDLKTIQDALLGLNAILASEGISRAHVFGISFGGLLAQVFVRRYPDQVADLVVSHSAIPCEHLAVRSRMQHRLMRLYPAFLVRWMAKSTMLGALRAKSLLLSEADRAFWLAYFEDWDTNHITKRDLVARAAITADYFNNHTFQSNDLAGWDGRVLVLQSSHDDVYDEGDQGALLSMYRRAETHTFWGYSHLGALVTTNETIELVLDFLQKGQTQ